MTRAALTLPRLANVAIQAEAAGPALGWEAGKAIGLMVNSRSKARQQARSTDPVAQVVTAFAKAGADSLLGPGRQPNSWRTSGSLTLKQNCLMQPTH